MVLDGAVCTYTGTGRPSSEKFLLVVSRKRTENGSVVDRPLIRLPLSPLPTATEVLASVGTAESELCLVDENGDEISEVSAVHSTVYVQRVLPRSYFDETPFRPVHYRHFWTSHAIDAEYNLNLTVDIPVWMAKYQRQSAESRKFACHLDIPYGPTVDETFDVFLPSRCASNSSRAVALEPLCPIFIFIHGGYWSACSEKDFSFVASGLTALGFIVFVPNYSLCPSVHIAELTRQCRAVVAFVYSTAARYGGDRERIFVGGHSAGGHLTAMVSLTQWSTRYRLPDDVVKGVVPISGLFDLAPMRYFYLASELRLSQHDVEIQSPCTLLDAMLVGRATKTLPPMLCVVGASETPEFIRQSEDYTAQWKAAGYVGEVYTAPNADHFVIVDELVSPNSALCCRIARFCGLNPQSC